MPRPSYPSPSLAAAVRAHFALTQAELARFLGVSRSHLAMVEAGHKDLSDAPRHRLWVLARQLPPPDGLGPAAPDFAAGLAGPPEAAPLEKRLRTCRFLITKARYELGQREALAQVPARRQWAVATLRPALAALPDAATAARWPGATTDPAADLPWLDGLDLHTRAAPPALSPAERLLALARLQGLAAEAAALEAALEAARAGISEGQEDYLLEY